MNKLTGIFWIILLANVSADDGFADQSAASDSIVSLEKITVQFEVFEMIGGKLVTTDKRFDETFTNHVGGSWYMQTRVFNALATERPFGILFNDSAPDVIDSRPFSHCPVLPNENDLVKMQIRTKEDFIKSLGTPLYIVEGYSFSGLFDIRSEGTRFCWILLEHSSHRLFVGYSKRTPVIYKPIDK